MGKPTLKTISQTTGLAQTTISRALKNDPKIALATRKKVAQAAKELGYVPDRAAQRLRTGRTNVIALVLSPHPEIIGFRGSMLAGLSEALRGTSYHVVMTPYDIDVDPMRPVQNIVHNRLADGLVFAGTQPDDSRVDFLLEAGFPFVTHGRTARAGEHAWCDYDNGRFVEIALDRLHQLQRKKVVLFRPSQDLTYHRHMTDAAIAEAQRLSFKLEMPNDITLSSTAEDIRALVNLWISSPDRADAFICPGEVPALAVMSAIQDAGLEIGRDVEVIAKQTSTVFDLVRPRVDTIFEDLHAAGVALGELLLHRIKGVAPCELQILHSPLPRFRLGDGKVGLSRKRRDG